MGPINELKSIEAQIISQDKIVVSEVLKNCGLRESCKSNEFPIHVYSGVNHDDQPKICIDGK